MFSQFNPRKRRERSPESDFDLSGFSEHRAKRQMASLPHRGSPKNSHNPFAPFAAIYQLPAPPTITPLDSDEDLPTASEPKSFFSPYSSSSTQTSPTQTLTLASPCLNPINGSQSTQMSDAGLCTDDYEMEDTIHLSPGSFHNDTAITISGRIPTPIHSQFHIRDIRSAKASRHHDPDFADDEAMVDRFRRGRRLPSPISEGEMSPSVIVEGLGDMQMEVDKEMERETPTKKGHTRSKHSLRNWTGGESGNGIQLKRSFTMGYRADCEKCRNKVPGHFSHIITYE